MYLRCETLDAPRLERRGRKRKRYVFQCDDCGIEFDGRIERISNSFHFCSRKCSFASQRAGARRNRTVENFIAVGKAYREKMGVDNVSQLRHVREKIETTCVERYG